MKSVWVVTIWSGGRAARKWKAIERPEMLPTGTGVRFRSMDTKLPVEVVGNISVEEYESGKEELENAYWEAPPEPEPPASGKPRFFPLS